MKNAFSISFFSFFFLQIEDAKTTAGIANV
jgi:hypothetical protein